MTVKNYREDRRPADLWYWKDWFSSFDLRACSLAARGLWMDMLGIMRDAEIKGTLTTSGRQIDSKALAKIVGATEDEILVLLEELEAHNVFSRLEDGTIINRRMFRESELSRTRAEAGRKGAEARWQPDSKGDSKEDGKRIAPLAYANEYAINIVNIKNQWCEFAKAHGLAKIESVERGSKRERALRARLKNPAFDFRKLLDAIAESPFLLGEATDFRATFDWIIAPSNYQKIIEGNYRANPSPQTDRSRRRINAPESPYIGASKKPLSAEDREISRQIGIYAKGLREARAAEIEDCANRNDKALAEKIMSEIDDLVRQKSRELSELAAATAGTGGTDGNTGRPENHVGN